MDKPLIMSLDNEVNILLSREKTEFLLHAVSSGDKGFQND